MNGFMKGFIVVHDAAWSKRVTIIRKKSIMSIAETLSGNALIVYGNDVVVETSEYFEDVIRLMQKEAL